MAAPVLLTPDNPAYPPVLAARLGAHAPAHLAVCGDAGLLAGPRTALFCSAHTPGDAILPALDAAARLRDEGATVIGGFHSPLEKECLRVLLRGTQPIIVCPARALDGMRLAADLRPAWDAGRLLFVSPFVGTPRRATRASACRRNGLVAALADTAYVAHVTPGGEAERLVALMRRWRVPARVAGDAA